MSEANKALVRRWFLEVDKHNPNIVDELIITDYIDHNPPLPDTAPGREGVKQTNAILRQAFSDVEHTIRDQIAEGDKVVTHVTVSATFTGTFLGISPNGKRVSADGIAIHRIAGGQLVEHWAIMDMFGMFQQLGAMPQLD
jgi:predicted ester cyclase